MDDCESPITPIFISKLEKKLNARQSHVSIIKEKYSIFMIIDHKICIKLLHFADIKQWIYNGWKICLSIKSCIQIWWNKTGRDTPTIHP